jgi:hypothetical protein
MISGCASSQESADLPQGFYKEAVGALTTNLFELFGVGYCWQDLITVLRRKMQSGGLPQIPQLEVARRVPTHQVRVAEDSR